MKSIQATAVNRVGRKSKKAKRARRSIRKDGPVKFGRLPSYLGYQIRQAQTAIFRDLSATLNGLNVTPGEYGLLSLIEANPGINQVDLAQIYGLDKSTLSLAVTGLCKRSLIKRKRSREDGRYYTLQIGQSGSRLLQAVRIHVEAQEDAMSAVLHQGEREQMLDMLERISAVFSRRKQA